MTTNDGKRYDWRREVADSRGRECESCWLAVHSLKRTAQIHQHMPSDGCVAHARVYISSQRPCSLADISLALGLTAPVFTARSASSSEVTQCERRQGTAQAHPARMTSPFPPPQDSHKDSSEASCLPRMRDCVLTNKAAVRPFSHGLSPLQPCRICLVGGRLKLHWFCGRLLHHEKAASQGG